MWQNFTVISSVSYFTNGNPYSTCSQSVECSTVRIQDILCHIDRPLIKMPVTGIFMHKWTPIVLSFRTCWVLRAYLCLNGWSELGGRRRWTWETGPVGWLRVQFEDHGILALAGSAWQKVSSCLSRRGADSPLIVFRPPVSCLSSTCLCVGRKILLELKKSFNRNFFFLGMFTEHFSRAKDIHKTNVMVSHHSLTASVNNTPRHHAEWIVQRRRGRDQR